ncbi:tRNA pseudouridine(13) synthase TruD [Aliiglaciecola sp. M165]|uniref:tRNA pseudouridine(13) synthase TruD n=1 Tax=Aliiglaciecola sp. M165 TaxID=2593649 RepID=UPI0011810274|nr:tRNA pseudouridine(13) synthase TruD [Aliiglaciecola sp. M165]TRY32983.1 tRNA pseudouridine(13) synthase TruD [Aliiglaciecola sp. M165]
MSELRTDQWQFLYGQPSVSGSVKSQPSDFIVIEELGYELTGDGEHIYLWVEKTGLNTAFVAEQIASFCQLPLRAISYAGRKDKHAVTRQWFGVHQPGKKEFDWSQMKLDGLKILNNQRHNKKLKIGHLKGNRFELTVRDLSATEGLEERLQEIITSGVPNYYGSQRFGDTRHHVMGGNLALAQNMIAGEAIRNRNKRSMAISALRSWLFNQYVSQRLALKHYEVPLTGDICMLAGSNSFFRAEQIDDEISQRLSKQDIHLSAPLWGKGELASSDDALRFESELGIAYSDVCNTLESVGLRQERRAISLFPKQLQWQIQSNILNLQFSLPSGCFATSVLREVVCEKD